MDDQPTEAHDKTQPAVRSFTPEDSKLMIITFGATLAANIVTVVLVGLALASAHWYRSQKPAEPVSPLLFAVIALIIVSPIAAVVLWRTSGGDDEGLLFTTRRRKVLAIFSALTMGPVAIFIILVLVGLAAGIK